jgi:hypothetical protein
MTVIFCDLQRKIWCAHGAQGEDGQLGHRNADDHHLPTIVSAHNTMKSHPLHLVLIIPLLTGTPRKMFTVGAGNHHHHAPLSQLGFHLANWFIAFSFGFLLFVMAKFSPPQLRIHA